MSAAANREDPRFSSEPSSGSGHHKTRRPAKPKRQYRGIEAVWSQARRCWMWRARKEWVVAGQRVSRVGTLRVAQLHAHDDYLALGELDETPHPHGILTLGQALDLIWRMDLERGLPESTVRCMVGGHGRALKRSFGAERQLSTIDAAAIRTYARKGRDAGRSPNTMRTKDLPLLRRCADALGETQLVAIITATRKELMRSILKPETPQMQWFRPEEVRELLARMRRRPILDKQNHHVTLNEAVATHDADLVQLIATTGIRVMELGRTTLADVERGTLRVRKAKDRSHPREVDIGPDLAPVIERLEARARAELRPTTPRDQILLVPAAHRVVNTACKRWIRILGDPRLSGRTLRHSFVTAVLATGGTSLDAMAAAGHRSMRTTDRYVHALSSRPGERRAAVAAAFGLAADAPAETAAPAPETPTAAAPGAPRPAAPAELAE